MSLQRQLLVLLCSVLSIGFLFKAGFLSLQRFLIVPSNHPLLAQAQEANSAQDTPESQLPHHIEIPKINVSLPISVTEVLHNEWQVSSHGVSLLKNQLPLDNPGTHPGYIMYGHNWPSLLGKLSTLKNGDAITLTYNNGRHETYKIVSTFTVAPDQLEVLQLAKPGSIVLYTCTGFLDSQRLVVIAQIQ